METASHDFEISDAGTVPVYPLNTIVIGSGAAGLNCARQLHDLGEDSLAVVTSKLGAGTSNNSGSDKQTYYKLGVFGDVADSPMDFARTLTQGGMCHGDTAYCEALGSAPAFFHLARIGVEFPFNKYGAYVGYKTDHDPRQRGTSAGPKTSMQMFECLLEECRKRDVHIFDGYEVIRLLKDEQERVVGALALNRERLDEPGHGLTAFAANTIVLATGGPGELFATTVYPRNQVGSHGLALQIGARANNMSEFQFGIASTGFRWNLSGSYQQVVPCYFSTDEEGNDVRYFLNEYYETMSQVATNTFLKGYQWPFHADRLQNYGSSLVDIAIHREMSDGRRVYMDLSRNPVPGRDMDEFSLDVLSGEAREYLQRSDATADTPYERLQSLNPLAIDIYSEHGVDLREPVEVGVCAQHCNGGLSVNIWWETSVAHLFAIGEVAGTHGVRPGGSALNAGQVGGRRAGEYIANVYTDDAPDPREWAEAYGPAVDLEMVHIERLLDEGERSSLQVRHEIARRMDSAAGIIRSLPDVADALAEAKSLYSDLSSLDQHAKAPDRLIEAYQNEHLALTSLVVLRTISDYIRRGGGSRGAYMVVDRSGDRLVETARGDMMPHRSENLQMRDEVIQTWLDSGGVRTDPEQVRPLPEDDSWFETTWQRWRDGEVFEE